MGAVQSVVETVALRPPKRPVKEPALPQGAERETVLARYSRIPLYIFTGDSLRELDDRSDTPSKATLVDRPWIIYSHGTTEDCTGVFDFAESLAFYTNTTVVIYEYPGYGLSKPAGKHDHEEVPSEEGMYAAILKTYEYLTEEKRVSADNIVAMGWSIGSGPTMELASTKPLGGVIIQSAFQSIMRLKMCTPWSFSCDPFQNGSKARKLRPGTRVLIMHGTEDEIVPLSHGKLLYEQMRKEHDVQATWFEGKRHCNLPEDANYVKTIKTWLSGVCDSASGLNTSIIDTHQDNMTELHKRTTPVGLFMASPET